MENSKNSAKKKNGGGSRTFHIVTNVIHRGTGETILTKDDAIEIINHHKQIKQCALILHDKDVYTQAEEINNHQHTAGTLKPEHLHIVFKTDKYLSVETVAKWFGISSNFIDLPKGKGAFTDSLRYLTHESESEQALGKHLYSDDEVITKNLDFREHLTKQENNKKLYNQEDIDNVASIKLDILYKGKTLQEVSDEFPLVYINNFETFRKLRTEYLNTIASPPPFRINFYISGAGGTGKGLCSRALARALIDPEGTKDDKEIFFTVGSNKTSFEGYDGQPVIIWDDCRSMTLWNKLGGRENIFNVFDMFPQDIRQNIKYSSIRLNNIINIVNSVQDNIEFLDSIAGEFTDKNGTVQSAEDKNQSYRRFPFIIKLKSDTYDLLVNKGVIYQTKEFQEFTRYRNICGNFQDITTKCAENIKLRNEINYKTLKLVVDLYKCLVDLIQHKQTATDDEIRNEFKDNGTVIKQIPTLFTPIDTDDDDYELPF